VTNKRRTKLRIAVLSGGPGSEREVSLDSGRNVVRALETGENKSRYIVIPLKFRDPRLLMSRLQRIQPHVVFPVLHGEFGEDGKVQALLEVFGKPYIGSRVLASALAMDKVISSKLLHAEGVRVPKEITPRSQVNLFGGVGSCIVKPRNGGSSVGVSIVRNKKDLQKAIKLAEREGEPLVQEYLSGREFTCGVLEFAKGKPSALPVTEIIPKSKFFDYKAKYMKGGSEEITPAGISRKLTEEIQQRALLAHKVLACRHISRSDFIYSRGKLYYLETNTMPGMTSTSLIPQAVRAAKMTMPEFCDRLVQATLQ